jgi:hypothetical protein
MSSDPNTSLVHDFFYHVAVFVFAIQCDIQPPGDSAAVGRWLEAPDRKGRLAVTHATLAHFVCPQ